MVFVWVEMVVGFDEGLAWVGFVEIEAREERRTIRREGGGHVFKS